MFKLSTISISISLLAILTFSSMILAAPYISEYGIQYETPSNLETIGTDTDNRYQGVGIASISEADVTLHENLKSIFTTSYGLYAEGASIFALHPILINTYGEYAYGVYSYGIDAISNIKFEDDAKIITEGETSYGIYLYASGSTSISKITFKDNAEITTSGNGSWGILAASYGVDKSEVTFGNNTTITTKKENSHGAYSALYGGGTSEISFYDDTKITTFGSDSYGAFTYAFLLGKSKIIFKDNAEITTSGLGSYGVFVSSDDNGESEVILGRNASIVTSGYEAHGVYYRGGRVSFDNNAEIFTSGKNADAFYFSIIASEYFPAYHNITATSLKGDLIANNSSSALNITFAGASKLYGDINGYDANSNIILNLKDTTTWEGDTTNTSLGVHVVNLFDESIWIISKDSGVGTIHMEERSKISFITDFLDPVFSIATIGNLTGSGIIEMNLDLSPDTGPDGDFLDVINAEGNYIISINHTNIGGAEELQLVNVSNPDTDLTFSLSNSRVQIGAYTYKLKKRSSNNDSSMQWYLKLSELDITIEKGTQSSVIGLGEFAKSIDATLSDEFLKAKNKLWFTSFYKLQKFDEEVINTPIKQQIWGGVAGLDKALSDNFNVGQFFGLGIAYQNIKEGSIGHIASLTTGVYANYINRGFLASGYLRVANYIHDLRLQGSLGGLSSGTMRTYGWSISLQASQKISLFESDFYLTPKAKASYTYVKEQSYDVGGMAVQNLDITGLVTWVGARIGVEKNNVYDKSYGYYFEAGWIHDTKPSVAVIITDDGEDEKTEINIRNNRFEAGIGLYTSPLGNSSFSAELKYSKGKGIEEPIKVNIGGSVYF